MILPLVGVWVAAACGVGWGFQTATTERDTIRITLERTACYGECPVYTVTLNDDGSVVYVGVDHVRVKGKRSGKVDPKNVRALAKEMERAGFFSLRDKYDGSMTLPNGLFRPPPTDRSTQIVTLTIGTRTKRVVDYYGSPESLQEIQERIDEVSGSKQWVSIDLRTLHTLLGQGWKPTADEGVWIYGRALLYDDVDVLRALLDIGFDPNRYNVTRLARPLMDARSANAVRVLLAAGADPNAHNDNGGTPLDAAVSVHADPEAIRLLLAAGARVDEPSYGGRTALMAAAGQGNAEAVAILLAAGANPTAVEANGLTAQRLARSGLEQAAERERDPDPFRRTGMPRPEDFNRVLKLLQEAEARRKR